MAGKTSDGTSSTVPPQSKTETKPTSSPTSTAPSISQRIADIQFIFYAGLINMALSIAIIILNMVHHRKLGTTVAPTFFGILASSLVFIGTFLHLTIKHKSAALRTWLSMITRAICFSSLISAIASIVILTLDGIGTAKVLDNLPPSRKTVIIVFSSLGIGSNIVLALIAGHLTWTPAYRAARSLMSIASVLLFVVGTLLVSANSPPWLPAVLDTSKNVGTFAFHQHVGTLVTAVAVLGFAICTAIHETNRIQQLFTKFIQFYMLFSACVIILFIVLFAISMDKFCLAERHQYHHLRDSLLSDLVIDGLGLLLLIFNFICANYLQALPPLHLGVEVLDINSLADHERAAYAKLITRHGKQTPGAPAGDAAMSLMLAYVNAPVPNMACSVLRVYKLDKPKTSNNAQRPDSGTDGWAWEKDKGWLHLDEEKMVLRDIAVDEAMITSPLSPAVAPLPRISKRQQRKKLAMLQEMSVDSVETLVPTSPKPVIPILSPEFKAQLESTEALILLTAISDYDLTSSMTGWLGAALAYTVGQKSLLKPLCIRIGLLATHFPFRESTFYCSHARRPVARSAAVLRAVAEWNHRLPRSQRCAALLDPTYQHDVTQKAIIPSGWQSLPLAPSHIIDLEPYKGKTVQEYLKAIKYRDQEGMFKKANGEVIESTEFTMEECGEVMRLWRMIASKRTGSGETATLITPDETFIHNLRDTNNNPTNKGHRSLLFLKANGQTVASCVLFRLGSTITSDLQGLDHELARPLKAYFVMMQHVIAIALREGCRYVDFGPTTPKPKMDIGCKSVPLVGAMHCESRILSTCVGMSAQMTTSKL